MNNLEQMWINYGESYAELSMVVAESEKLDAKEQSAEAAKRALDYFLKAKDFQQINSVLQDLSIGPQTPHLWQIVINKVQTILEQVPEGAVHWCMCAHFAGFLHSAGQLDKALIFYQQAVAEAEAAQDFSDLNWICHNWADALCDVGELSQARENYLRSIELYKQSHLFIPPFLIQRFERGELKGPNRKLDILSAELRILKIDLMQERLAVTEALPEIEQHLTLLRNWWQRCQKGETVPELLPNEDITQFLLDALDIAESANRRLENWEICLELLSEMETVAKANGESAYTLANYRFHRYIPLLKLGKLKEAQRVLEVCMQEFRQFDDLEDKARVLSALAEVSSERDDFTQAIALERQALTMYERLANPSDCAISHGNLSVYLYMIEQDKEAEKHMLAELIYDVVTENQAKIEIHMELIGEFIEEDAKEGISYDLPRLADLLNSSKFNTVFSFLQERNINIEELQMKIDELVKTVREKFEKY